MFESLFVLVVRKRHTSPTRHTTLGHPFLVKRRRPEVALAAPLSQPTHAYSRVARRPPWHSAHARRTAFLDLQRGFQPAQSTTPYSGVKNSLDLRFTLRVACHSLKPADLRESSSGKNQTLGRRLQQNTMRPPPSTRAMLPCVRRHASCVRRHASCVLRSAPSSSLWPRAQLGVVYDCWRSWYCQRVPLACLRQPGRLAGVILGGMKLIIMVYLH